MWDLIINGGTIGLLASILYWRDIKNFANNRLREDQLINIIQNNTEAMTKMVGQFGESRKEVEELCTNFDRFINKFDKFITSINDRVLELLHNVPRGR